MPHKIALLIHSLAGGGAERLISRLATRWEKEHEVHLVTWSKVEPGEYEVPDGVTRHALDLQRPSANPIAGILANISRVRILRRKLEAIAPDVALSFSDQMNIVALEAARPLNFPTWIAEHSNPERQVLSRFWELWRKRSYPKCCGCVVLTSEIRDYMQRWIPGDKLHVIPPAITIPDLPPRTASNTGTKFLFVGRLSHEKGVDRLLNAWQTVQQELAGATLEIVGDGPQKTELETLADRLGLTRVSFVGWQQNLNQFYGKSGVFVLPSRYEGFPVALLEALGVGLASVVTDCSAAVDELQSAAKCVEVVTQSNSEEETIRLLAAAMLKLGNDLSHRSVLSGNASSVAKRFEWDQIGPIWDRLIFSKLREASSQET